MYRVSSLSAAFSIGFCGVRFGFVRFGIGGAAAGAAAAAAAAGGRPRFGIQETAGAQARCDFYIIECCTLVTLPPGSMPGNYGGAGICADAYMELRRAQELPGQLRPPLPARRMIRSTVSKK